MGTSFRVTAVASVISLMWLAIMVGPSVGASAAVTRNCTPGPGRELAGCNYANASLVGDDFSGADLRRANLSGANLNQANFAHADLRHADLTGAGMVFDCLGTGLNCPSSGDLSDWVFFVNPSFAGADLRGADLQGATLGGEEGLAQACTGFIPHCINVPWVYPDAVLTGVVSGGITGAPKSLPTGWALIDGYLTMPPPPLVIVSPSTLAPARLGAAYTDQLSATGGNPPYRWLLVGGVLPWGLHLDRSTGALAGVPRATGPYSMSIEVRDTSTHRPATRRSQTVVFTLSVDP